VCWRCWKSYWVSLLLTVPTCQREFLEFKPVGFLWGLTEVTGTWTLACRKHPVSVTCDYGCYRAPASGRENLRLQGHAHRQRQLCFSHVEASIWLLNEVSSSVCVYDVHLYLFNPISFFFFLIQFLYNTLERAASGLHLNTKGRFWNSTTQESANGTGRMCMETEDKAACVLWDTEKSLCFDHWGLPYFPYGIVVNMRNGFGS